MERFPDFIILTADERILRVVTERAAQWISNNRDVSYDDVRHAEILIQEGDELILDAYMSGLAIRTHSGHSLI